MCACAAKEAEYCATVTDGQRRETKEKYLRKSYNDLRTKGKVSKSKINIMTVYESKGLEFTAVAVIPDNLTNSELYIAYTRALKSLAIVRGKESK